MQRLLQVPRLVAVAASAAQHTAVRGFAFRQTRPARGLEQVEDVPTSTSRKPTGFHRGPGKRQTSPKEAAEFKFVKKWDLTMRETWDAHEPFKGLPKPKAQFGNEACEVIWPYAMLLERTVKVHPFTKSIYVYYSQKQATQAGAQAAAVAKRFSREFLIPITFHNSQVYVETEMLLEYSETPWIVVHCLDGRSQLVPVRAEEGQAVVSAAEDLLGRVVRICERLGESVSDAKEATRQLNERPLQNQYLRIDYQWYGDTPEERMSHLVQWDFDPASVAPMLRQRTRHVLDWMNHDGNLPTHNAVRINVRRERARMRAPRTTSGPKTFFNSAGSRANARTPRFGK